MKIAIFGFILIATITLTSCGGMTACDCAKETVELLNKYVDLDESKLLEQQEETKDLAEKCKDYDITDYKDCL